MKKVIVEHEVPIHIVEALMQKGHSVELKPKSSGFGQGQIIWRNEEGALCGGTEPRADGAVVGVLNLQ